MVDADERAPERDGERLGVAHADEQRAEQARRARHRDAVDVGEADPGLGERALDRAGQELEVRARGQLGHDAAELAVHVLRRDHVREQARRNTRAGRAVSTTAAAVSSQEVSMPRTIMGAS